MVKAKESLSLLDIMEFKFFKLRKSNEKTVNICMYLSCKQLYVPFCENCK